MPLLRIKPRALKLLDDDVGTRREELLIDQEELQKVWILRKFLHSMDEIEAMEFVLGRMQSSKTNLEFFDQMKK